MSFDSYYDPPEEDIYCSICHHGEGHCTCPECEVCGEVGNPDCINTHMPWNKWGHFSFQLTEEELRAEAEFEKAQTELENALDNIPSDEELVFLDTTGWLKPSCSHPNAGEGSICPDCGLLLY